MTDVKVGNRTLLANKYLNSQLVEEQYGNGYTNQFVYDENGNVTAQKVNGNIAYEWKYDENGNAKKYGYTTSNGTSPTKINNIVNDVLANYGYSKSKCKGIYVWSFNDQVKKK